MGIRERVVPAGAEAFVEEHRAAEARRREEQQFAFASPEAGGVGRRCHGDGDSEVEGGAESVG